MNQQSLYLSNTKSETFYRENHTMHIDDDWPNLIAFLSPKHIPNNTPR